ncbi:hypothetical protein JCM8547_003589 [Rhodosporidiobolus lusitaniae]
MTIPSAHLTDVNALISSVAEEINTSGSDFALSSSDPRKHREAACKIDSEYWRREEQSGFSSLLDDYNYKVRLVAQGFGQRPGVDFRETFAPIAKFTLIRVLIALAAPSCMLIHQAHVDKAPGTSGIIGSMPPLSPLAISALGRTLASTSVSWHYIALYVNNLLFISESLEEVNRVKGGLRTKYGIKDLGEGRLILGIQVHRCLDGSIFLSQRAYLENVLLRL